MTRRTLFRMLVATLYLLRTGDARTYWIILPKRLKVSRRLMFFTLRDCTARSIADAFSKHRSFFDLLASSATVEISSRDYRIPFQVKR